MNMGMKGATALFYCVLSLATFTLATSEKKQIVSSPKNSAILNLATFFGMATQPEFNALFALFDNKLPSIMQRILITELGIDGGTDIIGLDELLSTAFKTDSFAGAVVGLRTLFKIYDALYRLPDYTSYKQQKMPTDVTRLIPMTTTKEGLADLDASSIAIDTAQPGTLFAYARKANT